jgi:CheY-like chemotaxis protein
LVIDDDLAIGAALTRELSVAFDVVAVSSGREALARIADGEGFDLVLCDLEMPEQGGAEVRTALSRIAPRLAQGMLFMTGGAIGRGNVALRDDERGRVLDKPIDLAALQAAIAKRRRESSPGMMAAASRGQ